MMSTDAAKRELARVATVYPSVREYVQRNSGGNPNETYERWFAMLARCDEQDVVSIVDEIVRGDREPWGQYEKPDAMPRHIVTEAKRRRFDRQDQARQRVQYHELKPGGDAPRKTKGIRAVQALIAMKTRGQLTQEESVVRTEVIAAFIKGGPEPDWGVLMKPQEGIGSPLLGPSGE